MSSTDDLERALERHRAGDLDEAEAIYEAILQSEPDQVDALYLLGTIAARRGDDVRAVELIARALAREDRPSVMHHDLGQALLRLGRHDEAAASFGRAIVRDARNAPAVRGLADALHAMGQRAEAVKAYRGALALDASDVSAWWGLGCALSGLEEWAEAVESLQRLLALQPGFGEAHHNLGKALFELGEIDQAIEAHRKAVALLPVGASDVPLSSLATIIPGSPIATYDDILEARRAWAARITPEQRPRVPPRRDRSDRPLRVGYVSSFFHRRNWMKPVWALINNHDRDRFQVHLFSDAPESRLEPGYRPHPTDRYHDISGQANADVARLIAAESIDILVDLNGYTKIHRMPLFAIRPAPVLVAWFAQFATTGLSDFDALIGDAHVIPPEEERYFTEPIARVAGTYMTFEVGYPVPEVVEPPCLSRGHFTLGSLAPQYKVTPQVIEVWARILRESPGSRLLLKSSALGSERTRAFVVDRFVRQGIGPERLELEGPDEHFAFLTRYDAMDVSLDTFPYNGGTSTTESLWQGVPVLTFSGDRWVERISASLLRAGGLPEFVAPDLEGYIAQAIALANDPATPARLAALRRTLRARLRQSSACDAPRFAASIEREYRRLWDRPV